MDTQAAIILALVLLPVIFQKIDFSTLTPFKGIKLSPSEQKRQESKLAQLEKERLLELEKTEREYAALLQESDPEPVRVSRVSPADTTHDCVLSSCNHAYHYDG